MSNSGETRYRLLIQQFEKLVDQLSGEEVPGRIFVEEQAVRLLTGVVMLLRQHQLNKRGQCRICAAPDRIGWFWRRHAVWTVVVTMAALGRATRIFGEQRWRSRTQQQRCPPSTEQLYG